MNDSPSKVFPGNGPAASPSHIAREAGEFFSRTGVYRAQDIRDLFGDPVQGTSVSLAAPAIPPDRNRLRQV